jgi:hypothetical protein
MSRPTVASLAERLAASEARIAGLEATIAAIPAQVRGAAPRPTSGPAARGTDGSRLNRVTCGKRPCQNKSEPLPVSECIGWTCPEH